MDRSLAGRPRTGRLGHSAAVARHGAAAPRRARRPVARVRAPRGIDRAIAGAWRGLSAAAALARGFSSLVWRRRRLRIAVLAALIATPLLSGGWLWLRHSSLVSVQKVRISGAHGRQARAIDAALSSAARRMSTLDVRRGVLRAAVASFPIVRDVRATPSLPHGLKIRVIEQPPVAALSSAGQRTAVAADGVVLGPALLSGSLPALTGSAQPAPGEHVRQPALLGELALLGAAPAPLARAVTRAFSGSKGLTIVLRYGLLAYFGDAGRAHAKWASLARVLADARSAGAAYVDVRVPERPAAGFSSGVAPSSGGEEAASAATQGGAESGEAIAARLAAAVGDGPATGDSTGESESTESSESGESSSATSSESALESAETTPAAGG